MAGLSTLSDMAGYVSIGCWLGAQFPQVLENIRLQSCEGLALPFLGNWFLGDLSNLIGCLLTHQLPFQTYLATYFVFVDLTLVVQYFYYYRKASLAMATAIRTRPRATSTLSQRSVDRVAPRYRTLSAVAANVAHAAALAAQHEESTHPRRSRLSRSQREQGSEVVHEGSSSRMAESQDPHLDGDDDDEANPMALSFYSEGGDRHKGRVTWSAERRGVSVGRSRTRSTVLPNPTSDLHDRDRGRSTQRSVDMDLGKEVETPTVRKASRASKRGASLVFLSVWTLFGIGSYANNYKSASLGTTDVGRLVSTGGIPIPYTSSTPFPDDTVYHPPPPPIIIDTNHNGMSLQEESPHIPPPDSDHKLSSERILGRIFAWLCTTLYLTSRLPQIWKNFVRKSVEGLSMYLFVFAFLGNCFYVLSIMTSPKVQQPPPISTEFLKESLPYLLGSGGTLLFDVTIVSQSFIYRPKPRHHRTRSNRLSEEEAGLLTGDSLAPTTHNP
ncbi:hypothetical protein EYR40_001017 [Pleurotus pulmonarius]|nr:hypothetical protein EYR38_004260 [Pleurotus pulmonarius]KAF4608670.1 hypothetical protein EYR40_001017 [Pleurotus pulmonarius]